MTGPAFSIIMPAYAAERFIPDAIASVVRQSRDDWELLVVDDGSPRPLATVTIPYIDDPRVRLITQANAGPGAARNRAAAESSGRYLTMLDADDMLLPDYLATVGAVLDTSPEVGLVGTDAHVLVDRTGRLRRRTYLRGPRVNPPRRPDPRRHLERLLHHSFIPPTATVRRGVFDRVGGYDPDRELPEDWDLFIRIAATGVTTRLLRQPLAVYRIVDDSRSRRGGVPHLDKACELTALKALRELNLNAAEQRSARFVVRESRRRMALARARTALRDGRVGNAREAAREAFRARPTVKGAVVIVGLQTVPSALRRFHIVKGAARARIVPHASRRSSRGR